MSRYSKAVGVVAAVGVAMVIAAGAAAGDWPEDKKLIVPGILNRIQQARILADWHTDKLETYRQEDAIVIKVPETAPDTINTVIALDIDGKPDIFDPPVFTADYNRFLDAVDVKISSDNKNVEIRYTADGSDPSVRSTLVQDMIHLSETTVLSARCFKEGRPVSAVARKTYFRVKPHAASNVKDLISGIQYTYYEGKWDILPDFGDLPVVKEGVVPNFDFSPRKQTDYFGFKYEGYIKIPQNGIYEFYTASDDGSRLYIGKDLVVDNNGRHAIQEKQGTIELEKGYHPIIVLFFEKTGDDDLIVSVKGPGIEKQVIPDTLIFHVK